MQATLAACEHASDFFATLADGFSAIAREQIEARIINYVIDLGVGLSRSGRAIIVIYYTRSARGACRDGATVEFDFRHD